MPGPRNGDGWLASGGRRRAGRKSRVTYEAVPGGFISHGQCSRARGGKKRCCLPACAAPGAASAPVKSGCVAGGWRPSCIKQQFV